MSLKTDQLRYFVTVAEEGQITRAARKLYIAQPALSQAIAQLESELGLQLLERHAKGVRLTAAGEAFLEKARAVVETERDVSLTAESLARAARGVIEVGFIGPPPPLVAHELFTAFAIAHPDCEVSFRELPFPRGETSRWLESVDVAMCLPPALEEGIGVFPVRVEPRALVVSDGHPLAGEREAIVAQAVEETFISYRADVQPAWAGFHSLDDHRGGPPAALTADHVATSLEMLGRLATITDAVTALPLSDARLIEQVLPSIRALPLADAEPASVSLVWVCDGAHPRLQGLLDTAAARAGMDTAPRASQPAGAG
jgi:LysR family transcriptional regulator, benzoate and cis,cis-muconate-responsive activator of ben and cat genes